ncbi:MAG TPA: hypothetical protein VFI43_08935 [Nitrosospira sp.]|nr:hypothetical protein [Nitrosospira sp.]
MKTRRLVFRSFVVTSSVILGLTGAGLVHSAGQDIPDEIGPADSPAVRDTNPNNKDKSIKERLHIKEGSTTQKKRDNSRYSTDGTERYDDSDTDITGTGPKREGRY